MKKEITFLLDSLFYELHLVKLRGASRKFRSAPCLSVANLALLKSV